MGIRRYNESPQYVEDRLVKFSPCTQPWLTLKCIGEKKSFSSQVTEIPNDNHDEIAEIVIQTWINNNDHNLIYCNREILLLGNQWLRIVKRILHLK